jgi:hypothetical protein
MTKKEKTYLALALVAVVILILWLMRKKAAAIIPVQQADGTWEIPAFNLPPRNVINIPPMPGFPPITMNYPPIDIPGLPSDSFYNYDMRSACACGGNTVPFYLSQSAPPVAAQPPMPPVMQPVYSPSFGPNIGDGGAYYQNTFMVW